MNNSRARLAKLLDSKLELFERMENSLTEQKQMLGEKNFTAYRQKCDEIDVIIAKIKDIDYDLARCESNDDEIAELISTDKDGEIRAKLQKAEKTAEINHDLMDELSELLISLKDELEKAPGGKSGKRESSSNKSRTRPSPEHTNKRS